MNVGFIYVKQNRLVLTDLFEDGLKLLNESSPLLYPAYSGGQAGDSGQLH